MNIEDKSREDSQAIVQSIINSIDQDSSFYTSENIQNSMQWLESYECWEYLLRVLDQRIESAETRAESDYLWMSKVFWHYLEDREKGVNIVRRMVEDLSPEFAQFHKLISTSVLISDDFQDEIYCLEQCAPAFKDKAEHVRCLERLCVLYEKKLYDEEKLDLTFKKILSEDTSNLKALRYFKSLYVQMQEWPEVVKILGQLLKFAPIVNDRFRIAQEMATVYLYHLDEPQLAINTIDRYCSGSPLDTTTIRYQANYRLKNWEACLVILRKFLSSSVDQDKKPVISFKIGELKERMGLVDDAIESYQQCLVFDPGFVDALENLIEINIEKKDWDGIELTLNRLADCLKDLDDKERVKEAIKRLKSARREY